METNSLKNKQVKGVVDALTGVACAEIKKNGNFKLVGMLNLNLKMKPVSGQVLVQTSTSATVVFF